MPPPRSRIKSLWLVSFAGLPAGAGRLHCPGLPFAARKWRPRLTKTLKLLYCFFPRRNRQIVACPLPNQSPGSTIFVKQRHHVLIAGCASFLSHSRSVVSTPTSCPDAVFITPDFTRYRGFVKGKRLNQVRAPLEDLNKASCGHAPPLELSNRRKGELRTCRTRRTS